MQPNDAALGRAARKHLVLVPGFVGFDVLGQIGYYAGVTRAFRDWRIESQRADTAVHYFDNFPTASVATRASRLRGYLAKLIARGDIDRARDEVTLLGHSTGGLDIRRMLLDLMQAKARTHIEDDLELEADEVLQPIKRIVFMSVPQYGTGLADFLVGLRPTLQAFIRDVGVGVQRNGPTLGSVRRRLFSRVRSNLLLAVGDSLDESDGDAETERQRASEREARAQLALWLEHMSHDFDALEDLTSYPCARESESPAHASATLRQRELQGWEACGIRTQSYVTRVPANRVRISKAVGLGVSLAKLGAGPLRVFHRAFNAAEDATQPRLFLPDGLKGAVVRARLQSHALAWSAGVLTTAAQPSTPFEYGYAACRTGSFRDPSQQRAQLCDHVLAIDGLQPIARAEIEPTDSDGVVNTLSMLWPHGPAEQHAMFLVDADHADIIGHYELKGAHRAENDRSYRAYDIFESGLAFDDTAFLRVWHGVFRFAFAH